MPHQPTMEIKEISLADLHPASYNPRKKLKKGDQEYEKIKQSLLQFGYVDPIIVNKDLTVIGGHQRLTVLKDLHYETAKCVLVNLSKADEKALNIALNKITGQWDEELLADLLLDLKESDFNLDLTGFEAPEVEEILSNVHDKEINEDDFDVEEELRKPTITKLGDIWLLGKHRLMCGDATSEEEVEKLMDAQKANVCITDPPYGCSYTGGTGMTILNDDLKGEEFYLFLLKAFKNSYQALADGGALYVFHSDAEKVNFYRATVDAGFHYSTTCIWVKNALVIGRMDYQMRHEPIIYAFKDTAKHKFYGDRKQTTIWEFNKPSKSKLHPTMKPLPLIAYPMKNSSQVNAIVLDLFGGSGSTLITAEQLNRICFTMELDPVYASSIVRRYLALSDEKLEEVAVIRNGETLPAKAVYDFSAQEFSFRDEKLEEGS